MEEKSRRNLSERRAIVENLIKANAPTSVSELSEKLQTDASKFAYIRRSIERKMKRPKVFIVPSFNSDSTDNAAS